MARDNENFGGEIPDRRTCAQHSGIDAKQTVFNWLLGILIAAIIGSAGALGTILNDVKDKMTEIKIELAGIKSDKNTTAEIHQRLNERITTLDRRVDSIQEKR